MESGQQSTFLLLSAVATALASLVASDTNEAAKADFHGAIKQSSRSFLHKEGKQCSSGVAGPICKINKRV